MLRKVKPTSRSSIPKSDCNKVSNVRQDIRPNLGIIPVLFIFIILALAGCMGLKTDLKDCNDADQKVTCFRQVALTLAAKGDLDLAKQACQKIDQTININADSEYFDTLRDLCFYDVAILTNDIATCNMIIDDSSGATLFGSSATKDMCMQKVNNAQLVQRQYKCAILFAFPLLLFCAFYANRIAK